MSIPIMTAKVSNPLLKMYEQDIVRNRLDRIEKAKGKRKLTEDEQEEKARIIFNLWNKYN